MPELADKSESTADIFTALAHPTRRQILQDLKDGEMAAGDIAARFTSSGPTISRHLSVLKVAGLVTERRDANRILYSLVGDRLALSVGEFLSSVCPEQMLLRSIRPKAQPSVAVNESSERVTGTESLELT
jgi:DNA-binding transcriptional ArsR family regulator